jgi:8-oxo-dGTP diphosphatase
VSTTTRSIEGRDEVASLAADVLMFGFEPWGDIVVALIKRRNEPFQDYWAFPGGYVEQGESFIDAAVRECEEETDAVVPHRNLIPLGFYGEPERDPRGRVVSAAFAVCFPGDLPRLTAQDDAKEVVWARVGHNEQDREGGLMVTINEGMTYETLAFDHGEILADAVVQLATSPGVSGPWQAHFWYLAHPGFALPAHLRFA